MSPRPLVAAVVIASSAAVCASCTSPLGTGSSATATNTASTYTPPTSIGVDAHSLFQGEGCGTGPGQVYKYVVIVQGGPCPTDAAIAPPSIVPSGVGTYDCFADAVFVNLGQGTVVGQAQYFTVLIDAFDATTYAAQAGLIASMEQDMAANTCPSGPTDDRVAALAQAANWTTTCSARQELNVQSLVACDPLTQK